MAGLKVFGGNIQVGGKQVRAIVATKTKKRAAELFGVSLYHFNQFCCETGNATELQVAQGNPETVFYCENRHIHDPIYQELER